MLVPTVSASSSRGRKPRDMPLSAALVAEDCPAIWRGTDHSWTKLPIRSEIVRRRMRFIVMPSTGLSAAGTLGKPDIVDDAGDQSAGIFVTDGHPRLGALKTRQILRLDRGGRRHHEQHRLPVLRLHPEPPFLDDRDDAGHGLERGLHKPWTPSFPPSRRLFSPKFSSKLVFR